MINKMSVAFVCFLIVTIGLHCIVFSQEIPPEVQKAAQQGLKDFVILMPTSKTVVKFENGNVVSDLASSYLGRPYRQLVITSEGILKAHEPKEILDNATDEGYVFSICNDSMIVAFVTVRYLYRYEKGDSAWTCGGLRLQSEYERRYYELLKKYPESQGHEVFVIDYRFFVRRFYMIRTPNGEYRVVAGSDYMARLLNASEPSGAPQETIDAAGALQRLRGAAATNFVQEQKLEQENKAWLKTLKDDKK